MASFQDVTEIAGEPVSTEQIDRLANRYQWAATYCDRRDVIEAACGSGPGLGLLLSRAASLEAGDVSEEILEKARQHYGKRVRLQRFDACSMPFSDKSKDVLILFEAIYYLADHDEFLHECRRVLRPGGIVLISTANKDLAGFNASPLSTAYLGTTDLNELFSRHGFDTTFFGYLPITATPLRQRLLQPLKRTVVALRLMPRTMRGKRLLKRLVFGRQVLMPAELGVLPGKFIEPTPISGDVPDREHKVIYCAARLPQ